MRPAVHCSRSPNCCLHDCVCVCEGCLPHSDPQAVEIKRLRAALEWFADRANHDSGSVEIMGTNVARAALLDLDPSDGEAVERAWASYVPKT